MLGFTKRPLFLIAWKNLKTYPVRILLTTSSIILGVAVIIASSIFQKAINQHLITYFQEYTKELI